MISPVFLYTENIWCAFKVKKPFYIFLTYCISRNLAANYLEESELGVCKSADPYPFFAKSVEPPIFLFNWSETTATFGNRSVKLQRKTGKCEWHCINFSQILVKKATCLITMTRAPLLSHNTIDHFTVVCSVAWPLNGNKAGGDLVSIKTSLFLLCKSSFFYVN